MFKSMDAFSDEINLRQRKSGKSVSLRFGVVSAVTGATVTITLGGESITGVNRMSNYSPTLNDRVAILRSGATMVVIGAIA